MKYLTLLLNAPRATKRLISVIYDVLAITLSFYAAMCLRLGTFVVDITPATTLFTLGVTTVCSIAIFIKLGLYRAILRFMTMRAMSAIAVGVVMSGLILATLGFFTQAYIPRSVPIIYVFTALLFIGLPRLLMRNLILLLNKQHAGAREPVIIYGAGYTGHQLAAALNNSPYRVVGFVDDDPELQGRVMGTIAVHPPESLERLIQQQEATKILLAVGQASRSRRAELLRQLEPYAITVQTIPEMADILSGRARIEHVRDVDIDDLLGRDQVTPNPDLLSACITDKVVMVTGAGGSIGSELCRQILAQRPKKLILFELNEYSLYQVEASLQERLLELNSDTQLVSLLGSVQKEHRLETIMRTFGVHTVYHAAAYKHVPLVEHNVAEGVRNNVFGTWYCAEAAIRAGVESFVLVSTDKAVRPTNIMGASKRMAELVLQSLAQRQSGTRFTMVRFGNVLDSSGSVVPLFRKQIRQGGPITVTHPEIIRYFMTITEAAELVIQAGAMGTGGDVFVLDMGEPVKISDLARRMVHLSGLEVRDEERPDGDIEILYTGLRPGEKLYEELLIGDNVSGTDHSRIMRAEEERLNWPEMEILLQQLDDACHHYRCDRIIELLGQAPTEYLSNGEKLDAVWSQQPGAKLRLV